jgi:hypothetical protein
MEQKSSEMHAEVYSEELAGRNHLGDVGVAGKDNNETDLTETECKNVDSVQLAQYRVHFQSLVNTAMRLWVKKAEIS